MLKGMSENEVLQNRNWNVLIYMAGVVIRPNVATSTTVTARCWSVTVPLTRLR